MTPQELRGLFGECFGGSPQVACAPGRVNLIGEHTDYNGGFVLPAAIDLSTRVAFAAGTSAHVVVRSVAFAEQIELVRREHGGRRDHWSDYVAGVLRTLEERGIAVPPADLLIDSDLPPGSGLSSSAALEVAVARALLELSGVELSPPEIALLCQRAENEFVGARCGIMDQFASCLSQPGHALLLDCRSQEFSYVVLPDAVEIVVVDSGVRHALAGGEYNRRRAECEASLAILAQRAEHPLASLRDVTRADLEASRVELGEGLYRRTHHVVAENERVLGFVVALQTGDLQRAGVLLASSHQSLREDYEVSCDALDRLVSLAGRQESCFGSRMTGGGFGGCTVNLVRAGAAIAFGEEVAREYRREHGGVARFWRTKAGPGARLL